MPAPNHSLLFYLVIALVQGLLFVSGQMHDVPALAFACCTLAVVGGVNLQLLGRAAWQRGTWCLVIALSLLMAGFSLSLYATENYSWLWARWHLASVVLLYIGTAFILSWPTREGLCPRYQDLFRHAWNNAFIVLLASLVTLAFFLLLWLCGKLFSILGMPQLSQLFASRYFLSFSVPLFFSLGMRMGLENEKVIGLLRGILLTVCRYLLPLSALIAVIFTLALVFSGLQPIWDTGYSTAILLCLVAANLFLLNGVFQDGEQDAGYARPLKLLVNASLFCQPLLVLLGGYSTWLRIDQYGLTPQRFLAMLLVTLALVHSLAALWAVLARQPVWLGSLRRSNPWIAVLSFVVLILVFTPLLNPLAFSARNQVERVVNGLTPVEEFDVRLLRYHLGQPGEEQFETLLKRVQEGQVLDEAGRQRLAERMQEATTQRWAQEEEKPKVEWLSPEPEGSGQILQSQGADNQCGRRGCVAWAVDLDSDGHDEVLLISRNQWASSAALFVQQKPGVWQETGRLEGLQDTPLLIEQIRRGKATLVTPRYKVPKVDGVELNLRLYNLRD
ncbi:hypothetical protein BK634_01205 [Pseudomonas chlororaphis]|nr:hypothetical protein BK634_01205 [Pseudomonas chlororaphis]